MLRLFKRQAIANAEESASLLRPKAALGRLRPRLDSDVAVKVFM